MLGFSFLKQSNIPKSLLASALVVDVDFALIISSAYFPPFKLSFSILLETTKKDPKINSRHWIQLWWIFSLDCTSILNWSSLYVLVLEKVILLLSQIKYSQKPIFQTKPTYTGNGLTCPKQFSQSLIFTILVLQLTVANWISPRAWESILYCNTFKS